MCLTMSCRFSETRWNLAPPAIGLAGHQHGRAGGLAAGIQASALFPVVAGIASALDYHEFYDQGPALEEMYDSKEQCRQDTALMHVPPYEPPPHIYFCIDPDDADWFPRQ